MTVDGKGSAELNAEAAGEIGSQLVTQMLFNALEDLNGEVGPGFFTLEDENGFIQVAGRDDHFVVEWGEFDGDETELYAAGFRNVASVSDIDFRGFSGVIHIEANELLALADAKYLCSEFVSNNGRSEKYLWRKINLPSGAEFN